MELVRGVRRTHSLLFSALVLASVGGPASRTFAQEACNATSAAPLRVESVAEALALSAAVGCTGGGTVEVTWAGTVTLDSPISVASGTFLSITGEDELAEVHGGFQTRMFEVAQNGGLTLNQLKLSDGSAVNGGAIYSSMATVRLESCVFEENVASGNGGAVWAEGGQLTIVGGEFTSNSASGNGGAVYTADAELVIEKGIQDGTSFESNKAGEEGGGLYCGGAENSTTAAAASSCSIREAMFTSNAATLDTSVSLSFIEEWDDLYGGGGATFYDTDVNITDSVFELNYAQVAGGGVFGGSDSIMTIDGCTFHNNTTPGYGAGVVASTATLSGDTVVSYNEAGESGGGVFGWDFTGEVEFNDFLCTANTAEENGGCLYSAGRCIVNDGATMLGNLADAGGCIYVSAGSDVHINGGEFMGCRSLGNGAFMYASDGAVAIIAGGSVTNTVAGRRAGVVYCSGDSNDYGGSDVTIEGGTFSDNQALELGGAVVAWGDTTVVTITGGVFSNNTAKFYGGFIFVEELASLTCEGATIMNHYAGDQGGAIYGREATWINSSCDLIGNGAPQGAAAYLTHTAGAVYLENHDITDNVASGGSAVYGAETSIFATGVNFGMGIDQHDDTSNRAVQLESSSTLTAKGCVFGGWAGDTVIHHSNPTAGSLWLDSCDFSQSSAVMVVTSPTSDAEIRNAVVGQTTIENAAMVNNSLLLVDRALGCDQPNICGPGDCVDSVLGVLCECLEEGVCLDGSGALSVEVKTDPADTTFWPDLVDFELMVSVSANGNTSVIWSLASEADELALQVLPSSGVLPPGGNVTVMVTGSPVTLDVGGTLESRFELTSVGDSTDATALDVRSAFYLCREFQYAVADEEDETVSCHQCITISGAEGLNCTEPGATATSLPVREGYWRSGQESLTIHSCLHADACGGATQIQSSDDYCTDGYKGPYCAVCTEGYGRGASHTCHSCTGTKSRLLIVLGALFVVMALLCLCVAVVFLIGGLDAVDSVRRSMAQSLLIRNSLSRGVSSSGKVRGTSSHSLREHSVRAMDASAKTAATDFVGGTSTSASGAVCRVEKTQDQNRAGPDVPIDASQDMRARSRASLLQDGTEKSDAGEPGRSGCCGFGEKIKRWASLLPMDKLKILVVVWQILTVFPSIIGVEFPPSYSRFLSWIGVVNLDVGRIFTASCILPAVSFYHRLLLTTLTPILLALALVLTHWMAKRRAGIGSAGVLAARAAWSRHMAAGLLLTFLVFTSTSTMAFKTFPCDEEAVEGESFLRADMSLSCQSEAHQYFRVYAGIMIVVYPVGIPLLYAFILWKNRHSLNPRVEGDANPGGAQETTTNENPPQSSPETLEEKLERRRQDPNLVPSMFLWKDFGPNMYYYEVIECGRRILLTGVLIFFPPGTAAQAAMACIFAFGSLLGFELLRPHLDPADSWLYRLGCVVIFLSNFLALLIKVDAAGEGNRAVLGGILIAVNVALILAVLATSWFATQQAVEDSRDEEDSIALAKTMLTFDQRPPGSVQAKRVQYSRTSPGRSSFGSVSLRVPELVEQRISQGEGAAAPDASGAEQIPTTAVGISREEKKAGDLSPSC